MMPPSNSSQLALLRSAILDILHESWITVFTLFRILIPALIIVRILELIGATEALGRMLAPLMDTLGLPAIAGLIWATAMLANIYTAIAVFFSLALDTGWTQAQVTILGVMVLTTHNLIVEVRVAHETGCRWFTQLLLRLLVCVLFALLFKFGFDITGWLQKPAEFMFTLSPSDNAHTTWLLNTLANLLKIALVITLLIALLRLLRSVGIERVLHALMAPLFRWAGIGKSALNITMVGMTLGLAYGGGLMIREAQQGHIKPRQIFASISLLSICHSLLEDTLLVMLLDANVVCVLAIRLVLSVIVIAILVRCTRSASHDFTDRWLVKPVHQLADVDQQKPFESR